jgi:hypothetical protein
MRIIKCDRCGKETDENSKEVCVFHIIVRTEKPDGTIDVTNKNKYVDLCKKCSFAVLTLLEHSLKKVE